MDSADPGNSGCGAGLVEQGGKEIAGGAGDGGGCLDKVRGGGEVDGVDGEIGGGFAEGFRRGFGLGEFLGVHRPDFNQCAVEVRNFAFGIPNVRVAPIERCE